MPRCETTGMPLGDRADLRHMRAAAFQLHGLRACFDQETSVGHGLLRCGVGFEGEIGHDQRAAHGAGHRTRVMPHVGNRHRGGVRVAEDDHAERVSHEDDIDTAFIEEARRRVVISRERGDLFTARFHSGQSLAMDSATGEGMSALMATPPHTGRLRRDLPSARATRRRTVPAPAESARAEYRPAARARSGADAGADAG